MWNCLTAIILIVLIVFALVISIAVSDSLIPVAGALAVIVCFSTYVYLRRNDNKIFNYKQKKANDEWGRKSWLKAEAERQRARAESAENKPAE